MSECLYSLSIDTAENSNLTRFCKMLGLSGFDALYEFSVQRPDEFWTRWIEFSGYIYRGSLTPAMPECDHMREQDWFPNTTLNVAENCLRAEHTAPAFVEFKENGERREVSRVELQRQVTAVSAWLAEQGVEKGDVVAGFLPNGGDAIVAMLATATLGATWTSCSPDFGTSGVLDRLGRLNPKCCFALISITTTEKHTMPGARFRRSATKLMA